MYDQLQHNVKELDPDDTTLEEMINTKLQLNMKDEAGNSTTEVDEFRCIIPISPLSRA